MKEAWICPKCNIGVAPHCDACPNCSNNLNLQGIPIKIDPTLPPNEWRFEPYRKSPLDPPYTVTCDWATAPDITIMFNPTAESASAILDELKRKGLSQ